MKFVGLSNRINLAYKSKSRQKIFLENLHVDEFRDIINSKLERRKRTDPFWKKKWENIESNYDELISLVSFIKYISGRIDSKGYINYNIDFNNNSYNKEIGNEVKYLNKLIELDLVESPIVKVSSEESYELSESSSGELHILFLITSILSEVENNSLIIMDEPEISLHPSWIIKFTPLLNEVLKNHKGCHIVIASHSHFILSDLDKRNSNIIILKKELGRVKVESSPSYTYGWSAENILYKVFGVPSCRNYYLTGEVQKVLNVITRKEKDDISNELDRLKEISPNLSESDPLRVVIEEILKRVGDKCESL
nr:AAA family ATPase [Clostridium botulinum]